VEVRSKEGASSALPFPLRGPIPSAIQVFGRGGYCQALAELVATRAGCWLLGKPGEGAHLGPRGPGGKPRRMGLAWDSHGVSMGLAWGWHGAGMGLAWGWHGVGMGLVWGWHGVGMGMGLAWGRMPHGVSI
jgi:hypothetical protein